MIKYNTPEYVFFRIVKMEQYRSIQTKKVYFVKQKWIFQVKRGVKLYLFYFSIYLIVNTLKYDGIRTWQGTPHPPQKHFSEDKRKYSWRAKPNPAAKQTSWRVQVKTRSPKSIRLIKLLLPVLNKIDSNLTGVSSIDRMTCADDSFRNRFT